MRTVCLYVLTVFVTVTASRSILKRQNGYGDEPIAPEPVIEPMAEYSPPPPISPEYSPQAVSQEFAPEPPTVEQSGYRLKRDNSYGDEPIAPAQGPSNWAPMLPAEIAPAPQEYGPTEVPQGLAPEAPVVEQSGYRLKRDNSYGDEPIAPAQGPSDWAPMAEVAPAPQEYGPAEVPQVIAPETPVVEQSGYRLKRDNSYGDEPIAPAQGPSDWAPMAEVAPAPQEYGPAEIPQEFAPEAPMVQQSGYRH